MERYQKHFVDISKHIETLLHLPVVTRETAGLIKLATNTGIHETITGQYWVYQGNGNEHDVTTDISSP